MLEMLAMTGLENVHLDLGHVGIYRALVKQAQLSNEQESELFDVLQRKARPELRDLVQSYALDDNLSAILLALAELNGGREVLDKARTLFHKTSNEVQTALAELIAIADTVSRQFPNLPMSFDLAELRGYHYHTGVVFAAFIPSVGKEIARGGRYDNIGAAFGLARPATGFSADLKVLSALSRANPAFADTQQRIFAPYAPDDVSLAEAVRDCRAQGHCVIQQLVQQTEDAGALNCTARLALHQQQWVVETLA
jgi:ATP phosphoribosyltransferase regulatory subunit